MKPDDQVDLVLFEIGGTRYAADLSQVRRIDSDAELEGPEGDVGALLGAPQRGHRGLVFVGGPTGDLRLSVDSIFGVRRVPVAQLRRVPTVMDGLPFAMGFWLDGETAVLLVDLLAIASSALSERKTADVH